ncbi:MAG: PIN domain-containing protein [Syntrophus sp. (in: bacteria)]
MNKLTIDSSVIIDQKTAEAAADLAIEAGVRGMDALVIQTAREFDCELITFDDEMGHRAKLVLKR